MRVIRDDNLIFAKVVASWTWPIYPRGENWRPIGKHVPPIVRIGGTMWRDLKRDHPTPSAGRDGNEQEDPSLLGKEEDHTICKASAVWTNLCERGSEEMLMKNRYQCSMYNLLQVQCYKARWNSRCVIKVVDAVPLSFH